MKALTKEWVEKAEQDRLVCERELRVTRRAGLDAISFHAQQCAEKYLKAVLQESGINFPKTHDLEELVDLLLAKFPQFGAHRIAARQLARHAVEVRYPGAGSLEFAGFASIRKSGCFIVADRLGPPEC